MRVLIDDRMLVKPLTGIGQYVRELTGALASDSGVELRGMVPKGLCERSRPREGGRGPGSRRVLTRLARPAIETLYRAALQSRARSFDLFHAPNHIAPSVDVPSVITVHDLSVLDHPEWHPRDRVAWFEREFERGLREAARLIAVSRFTRDRLLSCFPGLESKIDVVPLAPRSSVVDRTPVALSDEFANAFLLVGTIEPRKNISCAVEAHGLLPEKIRRAHPLVIAGQSGWRTEASEAAILGARGPVRVTGYVSDGELAWLYRNALAVLQPSFYEGFGLPIAEAQAMGIPSLSSGRGALSELQPAGRAALDPDDPESWASAMLALAEGGREAQPDASPHEQLSWERCGWLTLRSYRRALGIREDAGIGRAILPT